MTMRLHPIPEAPNYYATKTGEIWSDRKFKNIIQLKPQITKYGYFVVKILQDGRFKRRPIHQLILETFIGKRPKGMLACHGPKGKQDNSLSNLYWATASQNNGIDEYRDGTATYGEKHPFAKLTSKKVEKIRSEYRKGKHLFLTKKYGISESHLHRIVNNQAWNNQDRGRF